MLASASYDDRIRVPRSRELSGENISDVLRFVPNPSRLLCSLEGTFVNCDRGRNKDPDSSLLAPALDAHFQWLKKCKHPLFSKKGLKVADLGCGMYGTDYVHRLAKEFSVSRVDWIDSSQAILDLLKRPARNKHCCDAANLDFFKNGQLDLVCLAHVLNIGVSKNYSCYVPFGDSTGYQIVQEAARVLAADGLMIISFVGGTANPLETLRNIQEAGFNRIYHLHRELWFGGIPTDLYAFSK